MGWVLAGMAVYFIRPVLPETLKIALPVAVALGAGLHLGWWDKSQAAFKIFPWLKAGVGTLCLVLAALWITAWAMRGPGIDWRAYSEQTLRQASDQGKPIIIDFYADWCTPCRELEEVTFHHDEVVRQATENFVMVKVDVTRGGDPLHERLLQEHRIQGVPTIVFLDARGEERADLRLVDFLPPDAFLSRMAAIKPAGSAR
jgi:thiol:disulfide interchange protein DsbD